jgi:N-acyl amino acid synthase of PEP-CTERM/exosortase system
MTRRPNISPRPIRHTQTTRPSKQKPHLPYLNVVGERTEPPGSAGLKTSLAKRSGSVKRASELAGQAANHNYESLFDRYNADFNCVLADTPDLLRLAHEIRYQVYCVEKPFEDPEQHPEGCETDVFDQQSAHVILTSRSTGEGIGTVRLVLPDRAAPQSFSMAQILEYYGTDSPVPIAHTAEVSRFSVSKRSRPRKDGAIDLRSRGLRRQEPLMSLGLIQGLIRMSATYGITHWCAVMEPKLLRMLAAMGIHFISVGALLDYHGMRQLCYCKVKTVLATVRSERPSFWEIITDGGALASG